MTLRIYRKILQTARGMHGIPGVLWWLHSGTGPSIHDLLVASTIRTCPIQYGASSSLASAADQEPSVLFAPPPRVPLIQIPLITVGLDGVWEGAGKLHDQDSRLDLKSSPPWLMAPRLSQ